MAERYALKKRLITSSCKQESSQPEESTTEAICGEDGCCHNLQDRATFEVEVNNMVMSKKWYASKTLWILGLGTVAEILLIATETLPLTPEIVSVVTFINASVAAILRAVSKEKLTF